MNFSTGYSCSPVYETLAFFYQWFFNSLTLALSQILIWDHIIVLCHKLHHSSFHRTPHPTFSFQLSLFIFDRHCDQFLTLIEKTPFSSMLLHSPPSTIHTQSNTTISPTTFLSSLTHTSDTWRVLFSLQIK